MAGRKGQPSKNATSYGGNRGNRRGPGGNGRLPAVFHRKLALIAARKKTLDNIAAILDDKDHPQFVRMLDTVLDRTDGKVPQPATMEASMTLDVVIRHEAGDAKAK